MSIGRKARRKRSTITSQATVVSERFREETGDGFESRPVSAHLPLKLFPRA